MKMIDEVYTTIDNLSEFESDMLLETFGHDLKIVLEQVKKNYNKVWTITDVGKKDLVVCAGYHLVNRIGYLITKEEWKNIDEVYIY